MSDLTNAQSGNEAQNANTNDSIKEIAMKSAN